MQESCDVVAAGHICLDIIPALNSPSFIFDPGKLQEVGPAVLSTGGAVSNTGLALHRLGMRTRLMGKVSADHFGRIVLGIVSSHSTDLAAGMIVVPGETTSYSLILSPRGADRMFLHCPGCNDTFGAEDVDYEALKVARLFHFGYPQLMRRMSEKSGAELAILYRKAKESGITTSLDMCMPDPNGYAGTVDWPAVISAALPHVDIYMPSLEETLVMSYPREHRVFAAEPGGVSVLLANGLLSGIASDLLAMGPAIVGLKLGTMGLYMKTSGAGRLERMGRASPANPVRWANRELWSPCFKTGVVGTTGAGDATIAGFLAALLRDNGPEDCLTFACAVGACNVEAADAISGLLNWEQTQARLMAGWPRRDLPLDQAGWKRDTRTGVWSS